MKKSIGPPSGRRFGRCRCWTATPFLHIQCFNLGMVDQFITGLELEVLRLYHEEERTPMETSFLSTQSQMWIFALYEVLRMWRERCDKMIAWSDNGILPARLAHYERDVGYQHHGNLVRAGQVKAAMADPTIIDRIRRDLRRTDIQFTWMSALRMTLAKHEVMGKHRAPAS